MFPERLNDYISEDNAVRVIDVFIDGLDLTGMGFKTAHEITGRPAYHPTTMLKLYFFERLFLGLITPGEYHCLRVSSFSVKEMKKAMHKRTELLDIVTEGASTY